MCPKSYRLVLHGDTNTPKQQYTLHPAPPNLPQDVQMKCEVEEFSCAHHDDEQGGLSAPRAMYIRASLPQFCSMTANKNGVTRNDVLCVVPGERKRNEKFSFVPNLEAYDDADAEDLALAKKLPSNGKVAVKNLYADNIGVDDFRVVLGYEGAEFDQSLQGKYIKIGNYDLAKIQRVLPNIPSGFAKSYTEGKAWTMTQGYGGAYVFYEPANVATPYSWSSLNVGGVFRFTGTDASGRAVDNEPRHILAMESLLVNGNVTSAFRVEPPYENDWGESAAGQAGEDPVSYEVTVYPRDALLLEQSLPSETWNLNPFTQAYQIYDDKPHILEYDSLIEYKMGNTSNVQSTIVPSPYGKDITISLSEQDGSDFPLGFLLTEWSLILKLTPVEDDEERMKY